ncbi:hypothetical protein CANINC_003112 [Pichia inconspicua]|uniref:non-specific serine/threonine protein kinase n=1 Tax=Pichia inconspicua TaxID=52247 RepID=A0A4T0WZM0_9ASCO|nr:hypothetical protein CANINC_003112 [[Candida] inconspicua]
MLATSTITSPTVPTVAPQTTAAVTKSVYVDHLSNQSDNRIKENPAAKRRPHREVRFGSYVLGSTLGEGEFGKVKLGWRKDGKLPSQAAIKLIKRDSIPTGSEKEGKIYREITALKRLRHPNIVRLVEVLQNDKYIGIVLEYASGGELFDYILDHRYLKEPLASKLFAQLVSGVDYMHSKGIVHRDLKLENLLLDKHKNIVITDFGFVNSFQDPHNDFMKTSCGSPCYAAPELVVSSEPYEGRKVDVWSCGVILYAMLAGYLPFDDDPENPDGTNIARLYHYITHTPITFPEYVQPTPRDLLRRILVSNPEKRMSLNDVKSHRWLFQHRNLLSITSVEWDRNYRSSKAINQQDKINRRMSLMENPTSASLMLNKQNVKSFSSQNVQAALFSNPAAPQTSRTVAVPSAEASPVASPIRSQNIQVDNDNEQSDSVNLGRHSRSGSTASYVLQAVVDADVEIKRRYSSSSNDNVSTPIRRNNPRPISFVPMLSSEKNFETIKESPEHSKYNKMVPHPIPVFKKPINSSKPHRPRPTSYHPSYSSNSLAVSPDLSYFQNNFSESSFKPHHRAVATNTAFSSTSESLLSNPIKEDNEHEDNETSIGKINKAMESISITDKTDPQPQANFVRNLEKTPTQDDHDQTIIDVDDEEAEKENTFNTEIGHSKTRRANHENVLLSSKQMEPKPHEETSTKYKRFSLLTFYQNVPDLVPTMNSVSSTSHSSSSSNNNNISNNLIPNNTKRVSSNGRDERRKVSSGSTIRKPLEQSNNKGKVANNNNVNNDLNNSDKVEKETSTARKVMDFFKRRSMRI